MGLEGSLVRPLPCSQEPAFCVFQLKCVRLLTVLTDRCYQATPVLTVARSDGLTPRCFSDARHFWLPHRVQNPSSHSIRVYWVLRFPGFCSKSDVLSGKREIQLL